jgi:hypothetical protein
MLVTNFRSHCRRLAGSCEARQLYYMTYLSKRRQEVETEWPRRRRLVLQINDWWRDSPDEKLWMETTNRADIGADLNAPQFEVSTRGMS